MTSRSILTRIRSTLVDIILTKLTTEPIDAKTLEIADSVETGAAVEAGGRGAVVGVDEAVATFVTFPAATLVAAVSVNASCSVSARIIFALVNVLVAVAAGETEGTRAEVVAVVGGRCAGGAVRTFAGQARIHFPFAGLAVVRRFADAHEVVDQVDAGPAVFAGAQPAVVDVDVAVLAAEAFRALARVRVEMGSAFAAVLTGIGLAKVALLFTTTTFESGLALADELVEPVFTGAAVQART
jgi:hypothetical protein